MLFDTIAKKVVEFHPAQKIPAHVAEVFPLDHRNYNGGFFSIPQRVKFKLVGQKLSTNRNKHLVA